MGTVFWWLVLDSQLFECFVDCSIKVVDRAERIFGLQIVTLSWCIRDVMVIWLVVAGFVVLRLWIKFHSWKPSSLGLDQ